MLLQQITESLDTELDRLHTLRSLVVDLGRTPRLVARLEAQLEPLVRAAQSRERKTESKAALTPDVDEVPANGRRGRGRPRKEAAPEAQAVAKQAERERPPVVRRSRRVPEPTALSGTIPAGPVVVLPPALRKAAEPAKPVEAAPPASAVPSEEEANSLVRALAQRWMTA